MEVRFAVFIATSLDGGVLIRGPSGLVQLRYARG
jgi:hypothetical protein